MTLAVTSNRKAYTGTNSTAVYSFPFRVFRSSDLMVVKTDLDGNTTTLIEGTDYTVTGAGSYSGGSVTLTAGNLPTGYGLLLLGLVPLVQGTSIRNQPAFYAEVHEDVFDYLAMVDRQQQDQIERAAVLPVTIAPPGAMPTPTEGTVLGWVAGKWAWLASATASLAINLLDATNAALGDALVVVKQALTNSVARTQHDKNSDQISVFDFMTAVEIAAVQSNLGTTDVTTAVQNAVYAAWKAGKRLLFPAGTYLASISIPPGSGWEYRGNAFIMEGEGAGNGFLGGASTVIGTTIISPDLNPALYVHNWLSTTESCHIYIRNIRFEATTANAVVWFERWQDFSAMEECEVRQHGTGDGIYIEGGYGGTFENIHVMNDSLVTATEPVARTGYGVRTNGGTSGGLLTFRKVTARGFDTGFKLGDGVTGVISTLFDQCECSTVHTGFVISAVNKKTMLRNCYLEAVSGTCIQDLGTATLVDGCHLFEGFTTGIDASEPSTYGGVYTNNEIFLNITTGAGTTNNSASTGILVASNGDATGAAKVIRQNYILRLSAAANLVGVAISGANPMIIIDGNNFRPRRAWTGTNTYKITNTSTGFLAGAIPMTDTLNEYTLYSNVGISLARTGNTIGASSYAAGVLTLPVESSIEINIAGSPGAVTQFGLGDGQPRIVVLTIAAANTSQFTKGTYMLLSGNLAASTAAVLTLDLRIIGGQVYAYEIARTIL